MDAINMEMYRVLLNVTSMLAKSSEVDWNLDGGDDAQYLQYLARNVVVGLSQLATDLYYSEYEDSLCLERLFQE